MYYIKICPICSREFHAMKISTIYCSKKCNNRTRHLPKPLVASLVKRSTKYMMNANNYMAIVRTDVGDEIEIGDTVEGATKENPLGKDEGYLYALAKQMKIDRESINRQQEFRKHPSVSDQEEQQKNDNKEMADALDTADKQIEQQPKEYVLNPTSGATLTVREPMTKAPEDSDKNTGFHFDLGENIEPITDNMIDPEMKDFVLEDDDIPVNIDNLSTLVNNNGNLEPQPKKYKIRKIGERV